MKNEFIVRSDFSPKGDQPKAIDEISSAFLKGEKHITLLGATGSGKTFTMANVIQKIQKPTLVIAHNKILAAQLCSELKTFFPENQVEYFVSYYDYYQPEAYVASSDTYIEKDSSMNDELDKLRHSATASLFERKDVIVVSSVSCIYGLGDVSDYKDMTLSLRKNTEKSRDEIIEKLIDMQYNRNDINFTRNSFRVRGDIIELIPSNFSDKAYRIELFGDEIDRILETDRITGRAVREINHIMIFPASHYAKDPESIKPAIKEIRKEMREQIKLFKKEGRLIEAQRIEERTKYDIEMLTELGFCSGIENYARILEGRKKGSRPSTLMDYFPKDFLCVIDESHVTVPQIRAMYKGDRTRKNTLVDYGFRIPSALDNRPLMFSEFEGLTDKVLYLSATPADYEKEKSAKIVEQVIRPTGLLDPIIEIRPSLSQIDDLYAEILKRIEKSERILVTTLTKKMSEDLTTYFENLGLKLSYMHSDIDAIERTEIIKNLRVGKIDVLIGINLLREGLDLPEVSLVAILDADKEGFLRSTTALIQTIGRAARHVDGKVIMYADRISKSMRESIDETNRRRKIQEDFNKANNITPVGIKKTIGDLLETTKEIEEEIVYKKKDFKELFEIASELKLEMQLASEALEFEKAASLRDQLFEVNKLLKLQ